MASAGGGAVGVKWLTTDSFDLDSVRSSAASTTRCGVCKATFSITGKGTKAEGKYYHSQCFKCSRRGCGKPIRGRYSLTATGQPLCERCIVGTDGGTATVVSARYGARTKIASAALGTCPVCGKEVSGKYSKPVDGPLGGKYFHRGCFSCYDCKKPVGDGESYAFNGEIILCPTCVRKYM